MPKFYCTACSITTPNATSCGNEHCGQLAGAVIDRDASKRPAFSLSSPIVFGKDDEHPNCGTDKCCGGCDTATTDTPELAIPVRMGHDAVKAGEPVQIKMLAERAPDGSLIVRSADTITSTWIEDDLMYEYPDAFLLTLTLDSDKILAAIPDTKVIPVDMR